MTNIKRVCLWSGPRNISTALMYAFAQREDTKVVDEPLYAFYLKHHPEAQSYHPSATAILKTMEHSGTNVVKEMLSDTSKPVIFFKHMTHHLLDLDRDFMKQTVNIILTRNPRDMLPSFDQVISNPTLKDVGYALHLKLLKDLKCMKVPFAVLDSKRVLDDPERVLRALCVFIGIPFDPNMLSWQPQQREEDGIWAQHWYSNVHKSSGFQKYKPKTATFPKHLEPLLKQSMPYYKALLAHAI